MRNLIVLLLCQFVISVLAQDCYIDSKVKAEYTNDAKILALRDIYADSTSIYHDSIEIPENYVNKYLEAISAVYSLNSAVIDTIFNMHTIHVFPDVSCSWLSMLGDTSYTWVKNFLIDSVESGNPEFDSLMLIYDFTLYSYINLNVGPLMWVTTPLYLNLNPLADFLMKIKGLSRVTPQLSWVGDGNNIECSSSGDTTYISFSIGRGDCPAGCMYRKYWNFNVVDCNATYIGISGDITSTKGISEEQYRIYPNPFNDLIFFERPFEIEKIRIYDIQGKLVFSSTETESQLDLSSLKRGYYFMRFNKDSKDKMVKIIKR